MYLLEAIYTRNICVQFDKAVSIQRLCIDEGRLDQIFWCVVSLRGHFKVIDAPVWSAAQVRFPYFSFERAPHSLAEAFFLALVK